MPNYSAAKGVCRRRHIVELSEAGRVALAAADRALDSVQDEVLAALDDEERATLHALLVRATDGQIACDAMGDSGAACAAAGADLC